MQEEAQPPPPSSVLIQQELIGPNFLPAPRWVDPAASKESKHAYALYATFK